MTFSERHELEGFHPRVHAAVGASLLLGLLTLGVLFALYRDTNVWAGWTEARGLRNSSYSERVFEHSVFRTRMNTWSNYATVIAGVYALGFAWADLRRPRGAGAGYLARHPLFSVLFGLGCVYLGVASGLYHASLTRWGQQLDVASMYVALLALIAMNAARLAERAPAKTHAAARWLAAAAVAGAAVYLYVYKWQMSSQNVLSAVIFTTVLCTVADVFRRRSSFLRRWLAFSGLCLAAAIFCRQMDVAGRFTGADAWMQGHALWHVFCAISLFCIYMYYRSERILQTQRL